MSDIGIYTDLGKWEFEVGFDLIKQRKEKDYFLCLKCLRVVYMCMHV